MTATVFPDPQKSFDFSYLQELEGFDVVNGLPYSSVAALESDFPAASYSGSYGVFLSDDLEPVFAKSDGLSWQLAGLGFVVDGQPYPNFASTLTAGLPDETRVEAPSGRLYVSNNGYLVGADVAALGELTERASFVGNEASAAEANNVSDVVTGGGSIVWSDANDYVELTTTTGSDIARLDLGVGTITTHCYVSGFLSMQTLDSDANRGFVSSAIEVLNGVFDLAGFAFSELGPSYTSTGTITNKDDNSTLGSGGTVGTYSWVEMHVIGSSARLYVDHTLVAASNQPSSTTVTNAVRLGAVTGATGGACVSRWKNVRVYTIA